MERAEEEARAEGKTLLSCWTPSPGATRRGATTGWAGRRSGSSRAMPCTRTADPATRPSSGRPSKTSKSDQAGPRSGPFRGLRAMVDLLSQIDHLAQRAANRARGSVRSSTGSSASAMSGSSRSSFWKSHFASRAHVVSARRRRRSLRAAVLDQAHLAEEAARARARIDLYGAPAPPTRGRSAPVPDRTT